MSNTQVDGEQIEKKATEPPGAFEKSAQQETRKGMQQLEQQMNQQAHEQNERLKSLEPLITENQPRTENRTDRTEEAIRMRQQVQQRTELMFQQFLAEHTQLQGGRETRSLDGALTNSVEGKKMKSSRCENVAVAEANMRCIATKDCQNERPDGRKY